MTSSGIVSGQVDLTRVRGLLFDVDGTLSDTDDHLVELIHRYLRPFSRVIRRVDPRRFARWLVMTMETPANFVYNLVDRVGIDQPLSNFYNTVSRRRRARVPRGDQFTLIPNIQTMLAALQGKFPMAVVSARDAETTALFLEHFNLLPYFEVVVTAHTTPHTKPFPDPVIYAAEQLGLKPEDCLMIGDTIVDIYAGKIARAQTAGVLCGFGTQWELARAGADIILTTTADLTDVLL